MKRVKTAFYKKNLKLPAQQAALLVAVVVFLIGLVSSVFLAGMIARQAFEEHKASLTQKNSSLQSSLTDSMGRYRQLLHAGATLFLLKGDVSRDEWSKFYSDMKVGQDLPDTLGVGYVECLKPGDVASYTENIRSQGYPDFTIKPLHEREEYTSITFLEPFNDINKRAFGYDMSSEPLRKSAMEEARDNSTAIVTAPVNLVQDTDSEQPDSSLRGIIMYYPIYHGDGEAMNVEQRRKALKGFVFIVVRPSDILTSYLNRFPQLSANTAIKISDVTAGGSEVLAEVASPTSNIQRRQDVTVDINVANRRWSVSTEGRPNVLSSMVIPVAIISFGSLLSLAVAAIMLQTLLKRIERVERTYEQEVERTKDELLALASHQLRTPASGVKQYIGILTSGLVGKLTASQQQIAEKAYDTNERQIEIINQLLYVSKIEAGKITIHPEKSNITAVVRRLVEQHRPTAERKNIKLVFRTKRANFVYGDEQYYPMIIDNLLSNAIKYSYPDTAVTIKIARRAKMVAVSVSDSGVGIAKADKIGLFKKFNRIENPLSRSEGGSGLGLFLAHQLARAHDGDITVESALNRGSTFTLHMPTRPLVKEAEVDIISS